METWIGILLLFCLLLIIPIHMGIFNLAYDIKYRGTHIRQSTFYREDLFVSCTHTHTHAHAVIPYHQANAPVVVLDCIYRYGSA